MQGTRRAGGAPRLSRGGSRDVPIFLIDPLANLVMRFDVRADPNGLLQDLKKLLKLSHIG